MSLADELLIEFCLHKRRSEGRDQFAELHWTTCPRVGENVIFNSLEWEVAKVTHDLENKIIRILVMR
jgi:hypothetical protein